MSYLDYHSCLKVSCTPYPILFFLLFYEPGFDFCDFAVTENIETLSPDARCLFLQAKSNWEHLYFLKQWIKMRHSSLLKSTPLLRGNSVASPESHIITVPSALLWFARLVCQGGSTALPVSIYLARHSSVKNYFQDSMPRADSKFAAFQMEIKSSAVFNPFQILFGGGTVNVLGKLKYFLEKSSCLQN